MSAEKNATVQLRDEVTNTNSNNFSPAHCFELYGWKPDPNLSDDENYLDVVMLITRSIIQQGDGDGRQQQQQQQQGHMGALIVRPRQGEDQATAATTATIGVRTRSRSSSQQSSSLYESQFFQRILGAATNTPLFGGKDVTSDIHAEINALGQVCRSCQSTEGCTAYITIHPCKRCFAALVTFGIHRIVCRRDSPALIVETAAERGISVHHLSYHQQEQQKQRITQLLLKGMKQEQSEKERQERADQVRQQRIERKLANKERKNKSNRGSVAGNNQVEEFAITTRTPASTSTLSSSSTSQRRLWLSPEDLSNLSNEDNREAAQLRVAQNIADDFTTTEDTYDSLFAKFSSQPKRRPLKDYLWNTLSVGQEFVLTCLLLAGHRSAMIEEEHFQFLTTTTATTMTTQQQQQPYSTSMDSGDNASFPVQTDRLWLALALIWSTLVLSVLQTKFATSQQYRLNHRLTDFAIMAALLRFLSAVLRTLTASYSSDTVYALSIGTLFLHLLACNYSYANGWSEEDDGSEETDTTSKRPTMRKRPSFKGGTLSLTSVFFTTALLASRLQNNLTVYIFVCFSVVLFALYPAARHLVAVSNNTLVPILITAILSAALLLLLEDDGEVALVVGTLSMILFFVPLWKHHLQQYKVLLRGPWDIAHV